MVPGTTYLFSGKSDDKPLARRNLMFAGLHIIIGIAVLMIFIELTLSQIESNEIKFKRFKNYILKRRVRKHDPINETEQREDLITNGTYEQSSHVVSADLYNVKPRDESSASRIDIDTRKRTESAKSIVVSDLSVKESNA